MKTNSLLLWIAALTWSSAVMAEGENNPKPGFEGLRGPAYSLNESASTVYWEGSKPGGRHHGTIEVVNGTALTDGETIVGGTFELDMTSIRNNDIENEGMKQRLLDHLKSEDFFYVEKYPKSSFTITSVQPVNGDPAMHTVTGDLTIRGNTKQISFPAEISMDDHMIHARTGEITLDRTSWEVNHRSKSIFAQLKDNFIDDQMIVSLDIHLNRD
jgi:polyisoprenoid-binding protein YceI